MKKSKILIIFAHPAYNKSRVNRLLIESIHDLEHVQVRDLYELYPDFFVDVRQEQKHLTEHDIIIFQHPIYWYSSPGLLKEWQDLVLVHGFAYGHEGAALNGKKLLNVITMAGSETAYQKDGTNHFTVRELLAPFQQTANFCGMTYLPPFVSFGAGNEEFPRFEQLARDYRSLVIALRDGKLNNEATQQQYLNDCLRLLETNTPGADNGT